MIIIELFNGGVDVTNSSKNECWSMDWDIFWRSLDRDGSREFKRNLFQSIFPCNNMEKPFVIRNYMNPVSKLKFLFILMGK